MSDWILDASALLAVVNNEPGATQVKDALTEEAAIGTVNLAEVVSKLIDGGWSDEGIRASVAPWGIEIISFDEDAAFDAGLLRQHTRPAGLSLGDRACLALARRLGASVLTADRAWRDLDVGVPIVLIR